MINHPMLAGLEATEVREVRRHVQMMQAFDAFFEAAQAEHGFLRDVIGARMQLMDFGQGFARFRDRLEKAYVTVDVTNHRAVISDERWTPELLAIYRGQTPAVDGPSAEEQRRRDLVRACAWYVRKSPALAGVYKAHRHRTPSGGRLCASMLETLAQLLAEDCTDEETEELAAAGGDGLLETIEDCVIEDMTARQLQAFRADPSFEQAVELGRKYIAARDEVEKAIAAVRLGRWARAIEDGGFAPDANAFALARDEAARLAESTCT